MTCAEMTSGKAHLLVRSMFFSIPTIFLKVNRSRCKEIRLFAVKYYIESDTKTVQLSENKLLLFYNGVSE